MGFYDDMQSVATDILTDFKQGGIQYIELVSGDGPPDNPGPPSERTHTIIGAAKGVDERYIDGSQIVSSDGQITFAIHPSFTPKAKDFVIVGGKRHKIERATTIPPTGTPVANVVIYKR